MNALGTDILSQVDVEQVLAPVAITTVATKTTAAIATDGYRSFLVAIIGFEEVTLAETFKIEDIAITTSSTSGGDYTAYTRTRLAADVTFVGETGGSTITKLFNINLDGSKGYIKIAFKGTSSAGSTTVYAVIVKGGADVLPQN